MRQTMRRLPPLLVLLAALLLPALPAPARSFHPRNPPRFRPSRTIPAPARCLLAGPLASLAAISVNAKAPPPPFLAAKGDGLTDDTAILQSLIVYAEMHAARVVHLPDGSYRISRPLVLTNPGASDSYTSIELEGSGMSPQGLSAVGGTTIRMTAPGQDSVIRVTSGSVETKGQLRNCEVSNLYLRGYGDTKYGLHWAATGWSVWTCQHVQVDGVTTTGFQVDADARAGTQSANGESLTLLQCFVTNAGFYDNTSGQAYSHEIVGGGCLAKAGQVMIKTGILSTQSQPGTHGLLVSGFSASFLAMAPSNVFLSVGYAENVLVQRARVEKPGKVLALASPSSASQPPSDVLEGLITIEDSTFTAIAPGSSLIGRPRAGQYGVTLSRCNFTPPDGGWTSRLTVPAGPNDHSRYVFDDCRFEHFALGGVSLGPKPAAGAYAGVVLNSCWQDQLAGTHTWVAVTK